MRSSTFQDPVPTVRCRGKGTFLKTTFISSMMVLLFNLFLSTNVQAQNLYTQCTGCTSEDIKATSIRFDPALGASCLNPDQFFDATLYLGVDVTSNTRYGMYIEFNLEVNGVLWPTAQNPTRYVFCVKQDLPQGQYEVEIGTIPGLPAGSNVRLINVFTGWENQDPDVGGGDGTYFCDKPGFPGSITCDDIDKPRCKTYAALGETIITSKPTIAVTGPASACAGTTGLEFTITGTASDLPDYEIELYYSFTGGAPFTKVDNFDGSETIAAASPLNASQTLTAYLVRVKTGEPNCQGDADAHLIVVNAPATADAGDDAPVCSSSFPIQLDGSVGGSASSGTWSGYNGSISNATAGNATYTPSAGELDAGTVTLTWTTNDPEGPCPPAVDYVTFTLYKAATSDAGNAQNVCSSSFPIQLDGTVGGGATGGTWSGGSGTFLPNATTIDATYTPTAGELDAGVVTLTLTTNDPTGPCGPVFDWVVINLYKAVVTSAGDDKISCASSPAVVLGGSISGGTTTGEWVGGTGTFNPGRSALDATYTPSQAEIDAGTVTLTLVSSDPTGPCNSTSDWMKITINPAVVTDAGPNRTVCASAPQASLDGTISGGATTGEWVGGTGTFNPGRSTIDATYTPSQAEIDAGTVTLTLVSTNPEGPCPSTSDWMVITINANSSANAGPNQIVCANQTVQLDAESTPSTGSWSGGGGSYAPNNTTPDAVYTPSPGEKMAGTVTLTWTTTDPDGPCTSASDEVVITINPVVVTDAGINQTICEGATVQLDGTISGGTTSGSWSGGTGSFSPNANTVDAVYTPSAGDIAAGTVTLTLTSTDPAGPCDATSDWMVITINPAATAEAGPPQTICADGTATLAASSSPASGTWSGGGGSYNPNNTTADAVYTPSAAEKMAGSVTLTWTTIDPEGPCNAASDYVIITIQPVATITARGTATVCAGESVILTAAIGGSATSVTWATVPAGLGTFSNPNADGTSITFTPTSTGAITVRATTNDPEGPCGSAYSDVIVTANTCSTGYCTYTQGGFGNEGGKDSYIKNGDCFKSTGATMTVKDALAGWGGGGMQVSNMNFVSTSNDDVALIIAYLPNGGPSKAYTGTKANLLTAGDKNTLLAQTITLGLNMGLNPTLKDFTLENRWLVTGSSDNCGETPDGMNTQCFKFSIVSNMNVDGVAGVQINDIWILANKALRGEALPSGVTLSALAGAADAVNNAFDECRVPLRWSDNDECSGAFNSLALKNTETFGTIANATSIGQSLKVKAYPNPFRDRVFISFTSPVSGKATVEIFDMTGRRLESINKGQVVAGRENTVEYTVPSTNRNSIIYRVTVDKFSVNGRLISPGINR